MLLDRIFSVFPVWQNFYGFSYVNTRFEINYNSSVKSIFSFKYLFSIRQFNGVLQIGRS